MAKTINGITFNNLSRIGKGSSASNINTAGITSESDLQVYIDAGEEYRNIQSVLIDWNGAELGEVNGIPLGTIKTTGDLIKVIQG